MLKILSKMLFISEETPSKVQILRSENKGSMICIEQETIELIFNEMVDYQKRKKF